MRAIGIDLGGTKISFGLIDSDGTINDEQRIATPHSWTEINKLIFSIVSRFCQDNKDIGVVGLGCAGMVGLDGYVHYSPNVSAFNGGVAVEQELNKQIPIPVFVDNDNNCAGYGEFIVGGNNISQNLLYIGLGTGIGGAIIVDGEPLRGEHGYAGDIGHFTIGIDGPLCACGKYGCFEAYASGTALGRIAREYVLCGQAHAVLDLAHGQIDEIIGSHVGKAAKNGDSGAIAIIDEYAKNVAIGVIGLINIFDPGTIVIGGGVIQLGDLLFKPLNRYVHEMAQGGEIALLGSVIPARLGTQSGMIGAGLMALNRAH